jgi:hypothetical protein
MILSGLVNGFTNVRGKDVTVRPRGGRSAADIIGSTTGKEEPSP